MSLTIKRLKYLSKLVEADKFKWKYAADLEDCCTQLVNETDPVKQEKFKQEYKWYQEWLDNRTGSRARLLQLINKNKKAKNVK